MQHPLRSALLNGTKELSFTMQILVIVYVLWLLIYERQILQLWFLLSAVLVKVWNKAPTILN